MKTSQTGTVKWFNDSMGYGFIAPDDGGRELFAQLRAVAGGAAADTLSENARVQYDVTQGRHRPQAANIRPLA